MKQGEAEKFVAYYQNHIRGDEKGEAQVFLERFFVALGYSEGLKGAGAELEFRIRHDKRPTRFADLVWKPRVLIEMKKRGENLATHYQQAFGYWAQLVPNRPQYVILCNFDEFWIYDFNTDVYKPVDIVRTRDLTERSAQLAFAFLFPEPLPPTFSLKRKDVTKENASRIAGLFRSLVDRRIDRERALRYCLQCIVAMFADSVGLLPDFLFTRLLRSCEKSQENTYDIIGGLFREMNYANLTPTGRYKGVDYFNGGLFQEVHPIELTSYELDILSRTASNNWNSVNPAIFGTILEQALEAGERHALGAHYTYEIDIKKIVTPVIVEPWQEKIEAARTTDDLYALLRELVNYRVLDPACGSGNFLFIAFKELKLIEQQIINRLRALSTSTAGTRRLHDFLLDYPFVSTSQFYGIDKKPFSVELAKVTLIIAKELAYFEFEEAHDSKFKPLPLDNLDENIICADALLHEEENTPRAWPEVDVIIGNPPFQSKNKMQQEFGQEYLNRLRAAYPEVPGRADFCVYWFYKAHQHLRDGQYAGLVGTNTIRQNYSREGSLDYITQNGGVIFNAVSSQPWSGEAAVYVSIVNWKKGGDKGRTKRLFFENETGGLTEFEVPAINSSLSRTTDVATAECLQANKKPKRIFQGQTHGHEGFLLPKAEALKLLDKHPEYAKVLKPFLIARELVAGLPPQPDRFVIDFTGKELAEAAAFKVLFQRVKQDVFAERKERAEMQEAENQKTRRGDKQANINQHHINFFNSWWQLSYGREDMLRAITDLRRYIVCSRVSKRPIFDFLDPSIHPNDALMVFAFEDDYSFGIIQSNYHWEWWQARCSTLGKTFRYTGNTVWKTFPWPQTPSEKAIRAVAAAARELRQERRKVMKKNKLSFRELYRVLELPGKSRIKDLHHALDEAVRQAYGFPKNSDLLADLLALNQQLARDEADGKAITAPGLPENAPAGLVSTDCIQVT